MKMQKQKLQLPPQAPPQTPPGPPPPATQVQPPPPTPQQSPQLTTVTASRPGALLTGTTVTNLQVARLVSSPGDVAFPRAVFPPGNCHCLLRALVGLPADTQLNKAEGVFFP